MKRLLSAVILVIIYSVSAFGQNIDIESVGKMFKNKPFVFNGGISLGSVFYSGNQVSGRQDWTYYINGNLNVSIYGQINIPVSINITNLGKNISYPSLPNRLSLHPTYKWITGHIGDVSMTFSPYTLAGHQFTGGGIELSPGKYKIAAMGGQLLRKVKYDAENPNIMPNYSRMGYGIKAQYEDTKFGIGLIYFGAKDNEDADMQYRLDSLGVYPMKNNVISANAKFTPFKNMTITAEYALSFLTRDVRAADNEDASGADNILGGKTSTSKYSAFNAKLNYQILKNVIGIGYERIDPDYKTLGAYYFNNDYENITLNYARPFLKNDKANIAASFGIQRDDLKSQKEESTNRYVGSINLNYNPSERVQTSLNFSTFQTYRNIKSQFDYINETSPYDNLDTLDYKQLSQNLDLSVMWTTHKTEKQVQQLSALVSYQEAADKQGDISTPGNVSRFLNASLGYNIAFIPKNVNVTTSVSYSYSYGGAITSHTIGPNIGMTMGVLKKAMRIGFSTAYNFNITDGKTQNRVLNLRFNSSYRFWKKHNLSAAVTWQNRNIRDKNKTDAITTTIAYSYSF